MPDLSGLSPTCPACPACTTCPACPTYPRRLPGRGPKGHGADQSAHCKKRRRPASSRAQGAPPSSDVYAICFLCRVRARPIPAPAALLHPTNTTREQGFSFSLLGHLYPAAYAGTACRVHHSSEPDQYRTQGRAFSTRRAVISIQQRTRTGYPESAWARGHCRRYSLTAPATAGVSDCAWARLSRMAFHTRSTA